MDRGLERDLSRGLDDAPSSTPRRPDRITAAAVTRWVRERARATTWSLAVPGYHPGSDLTYDELLDVLEEQGRDFRADTTALRRSVLADVQLRLADLGRMPLAREFNDAFAAAVLAFIAKRFGVGGFVRDIKPRRLTLAYAKRKAADGYGANPIGVRTGALANRLADFGIVRVRKG